jgi:hypothetical protein
MPPLVTAQKAVGAFTFITEYYDAHGLYEKVGINVFCVEERLQR